MQKSAFERTGLVPRSIIRTFDRFRRQLLPGAEDLVIQEFRVSKYQVLVSVRCLASLLFFPLLVNYLVKTTILIPLAEYIWNTQQNEIFLNFYQENRAFLEMRDFEEKIFFESLVSAEDFTKETGIKENKFDNSPLYKPEKNSNFTSIQHLVPQNVTRTFCETSTFLPCKNVSNTNIFTESECKIQAEATTSHSVEKNSFVNNPYFSKTVPFKDFTFQNKKKSCDDKNLPFNQSTDFEDSFLKKNVTFKSLPLETIKPNSLCEAPKKVAFKKSQFFPDTSSKKAKFNEVDPCAPHKGGLHLDEVKMYNPNFSIRNPLFIRNQTAQNFVFYDHLSSEAQFKENEAPLKEKLSFSQNYEKPFAFSTLTKKKGFTFKKGGKLSLVNGPGNFSDLHFKKQNLTDFNYEKNFSDFEIKNFSKIDDILLQKKFQEKTIELAHFYNQQTISAIANVFGDFITLITIAFLFVLMKPQIIILKSFLTESIYSLSDTTKSFLLILLTDLLVGFHSPRGWEILIEILLRHFGLPENQDFVFLFVATLPVLLDTVFKYWIFRYLNQISPSTVATYHSMIE